MEARSAAPQREFPPPLVVVQKTGAAPNAKFPPGDKDTHPYGAATASTSLPIGYTILGWLLSPPVVGECVCVLRLRRNEVWCEGVFMSSPVTAVEGDIFITRNSSYRITLCNDTETGELMRRPVPPPRS